VVAPKITIKTKRRSSAGVEIQQTATTEAATNKLYHAAVFDMPEQGWYSVEVCTKGTLGEAQIRFEMEAAGPMPPWLAMVPWVGWPFLAVLLFGIHQLLVRWRSRCVAKAMTNYS